MSDHSRIEILQSLARQRGRGDQSPVLLLRMLEAREGARISHLPIHQSLEHAWVAVTGEPFRPHQSLALASLRRGEPFALVGGGAAARRTLYLLLHDVLHNEERSRVLFLVPNEETATIYLDELDRLSRALGRMLQATRISEEHIAPHVFTARVLFITPETLHRRLLRHYDRAWRTFWNDLRLVFITDLEHYHGVAAEHLAGLLLRSMRLTPPDASIYMAATLAETSGVGAVLGQMSNQLWRIITVDDVPLPKQVLGVWQAGTERIADAIALALTYRREGYAVHIVAAQLEIPLIQRLIGNSDSDGISIGHGPYPADVQIIVGYPGSHAALRQAVADAIPVSLLVLGSTPAERTLARLMRLDQHAIPVLDDPPTTWALPAANAYVSARHLLCAAAELPLSEAEVTAWQASELVERLERQGHLVCLPDDQATWQPLLAAGDPYAGFGLQAAGTAMALLYDENDLLLDMLDPAAFDRWGFIGAALPVWRGSFRVVDRDEAEDALILKDEQRERHTFPLRRCHVDVRDERKQRSASGCHLGYGRVLVEEEIYGYREACMGSVPAERILPTPLSLRWTAPAIWLDLPTHLPVEGQLCGWSLVAALPLRVLCQPTDCVPAYDADRQRLYFIDAQPGGNGLAAWLYEQLEHILPLAYDVAHDSRNDGLLEPLARTDMDWMLTLLGGRVTLPEIETPTRVTEVAVVSEVSRQRTAATVGQAAAGGGEEHSVSADNTATSKAPGAPARAARSDGRAAGKRSRTKGTARQTTPQQPASPLPDQDGAGKPAAPGNVRRGKQQNAPLVPQPAPDESVKQEHAHAQDVHTNQQSARAVQESDPDPDAIIARLRRLRQQQDSAKPATISSPPQQTGEPHLPTQPRFSVGDQIICKPYGYGVIQASRIENGREILSIAFAEQGEITVDPAVNMVRLIPPDNANDDDVL